MQGRKRKGSTDMDKWEEGVRLTFFFTKFYIYKELHL